MGKAMARTVMRLMVWLYRSTGGRIGGTVAGAPILLITTTGRKSGRPWTNPVMYQRDDDGYVVIASNGGSPRHPAWWLNLRSHPDATIQVGREVVQVSATRSSGAERERLLALMTKAYKGFAKYETKTTRKIPVVRLAPR
jgi:deazaflavin-dependent oxidoreductase (nitroreductase family)